MTTVTDIRTIGTHDHVFHADDVFAVATLKLIYPDAKVIRTRDTQLLKSCDIMVDVGGGPFDHHHILNGGGGDDVDGVGVEEVVGESDNNIPFPTTAVFRENGIPYASFGLVWKHYSSQAIRSLYPDLDDDSVAQISRKIDCFLIIPIDATDNGVHFLSDINEDRRRRGMIVMLPPAPQQQQQQCDNSKKKRSITFLYRPFTISNIIGLLNPFSNSMEDYDKAFFKALELAETILTSMITKFYNELILESELQSQLDEWVTDSGHLTNNNSGGGDNTAVDDDSAVVVLQRYYPNWQKVLVKSNAVFVVYPTASTVVSNNCGCVDDDTSKAASTVTKPTTIGDDDSGRSRLVEGTCSWRCHSIPISDKGRDRRFRKLFPASWGGLEGEPLVKVSGVSDAIFCHKNRVLAGARTKEGAVNLARKALLHPS